MIKKIDLDGIVSKLKRPLKKLVGRKPQDNFFSHLSNLSSIITSSPDINQVYNLIAAEINNIIPYDRLSIASFDLESRTLNHLYVSGTEIPGWSTGDAIPLSESVNEPAIELGRGHFIGSSYEEVKGAEELAVEAGLLSGMSVLFKLGGEIFGGLNIRSKEKHAYTKIKLRQLEYIGNLIAGPIALSNQYRQLEGEFRLREEELKKSAERLQLATSAPSQGIFWMKGENLPEYLNMVIGGERELTDQELDIEHYRSPNFYTLLGFKDADDMGADVKDFAARIHLDDRQIPVEALRKTVEGDIEFDAKYRVQHRDGHYIWVQAKGNVSKDEKGKVNAFAGSITDITERVLSNRIKSNITHNYSTIGHYWNTYF